MVGAIIGAAIALIGGIVSAVGSSSAAQKAEEQQRARRAEAERRYLHEINKDFLDTDTAKSTLRAIKKQNDKQIEALGNNAVKVGASDEAKVAAAARANETYADAASRIAGYGTQYKQNLEDRYMSRVDQFDDSIIALEQQKAEAWSGFGNSVAAAGSSVANVYGEGAFSKAPKADAVTSQNAAQTPKADVVPVQDPTKAPVNHEVKSDPYDFVEKAAKVRRNFDQIEPDEEPSKDLIPKYGITTRVKVEDDFASHPYGYHDMSMKNILRR